MIVWRNDDISQWTKLDEFRRVHEIFIKYNVVHTLAVICRDLEKHTELIKYLNSQPLLDMQFHCLDHFHYPHNKSIMDEQFSEGVKVFERVFNKKPTVWFPPFNDTDVHCADAAAKYGMKTSYQKVSLKYYIDNKGDVMFPVVNFHSWYEMEQMLLEPALKIYTDKNSSK